MNATEHALHELAHLAVAHLLNQMPLLETPMDKYVDIRATLEMNATLKMSQAFYPDRIRALLADADRATALEATNARLREALKTMVEMVEMNGFGKDYAIDLARAALAQGES